MRTGHLPWNRSVDSHIEAVVRNHHPYGDHETHGGGLERLGYARGDEFRVPSTTAFPHDAVTHGAVRVPINAKRADGQDYSGGSVPDSPRVPFSSDVLEPGLAHNGLIHPAA